MQAFIYFVGVNERRFLGEGARQSARAAAYFDDVAAFVRARKVDDFCKQAFVGKKVLTVLFFEAEPRLCEDFLMFLSSINCQCARRISAARKLILLS